MKKKMGKKWTKVTLSLMGGILIITALIAGCDSEESSGDTDSEPQNGGQEITLDFATFWPAQDFQVEHGHKAWAREVKERVAENTSYALNFSWSYGGELLGSAEIYEGVAAGVADMGSTCPSYTPGMFPITEAFELPGLHNDNALVSSMAIQDAFGSYDLLEEEYQDVEVMHFWATGPGDMITVEPVKTLEDLDDMSIRVAGGSVPVVRALGGTPETMGMDEAYLSLNQGLVEGILSPTDVLEGFQLAEVTNYITKTPYLYNVVFMKIMNQNTWDDLPEEVQEVFQEVNREYAYQYGVLRTTYTEAGEKYAVDNYQHEIHNLSMEEEEKWREAIEPVQESWAEDADQEGLPGTEILETVQELDQKYSDKYGDYFD